MTALHHRSMCLLLRNLSNACFHQNGRDALQKWEPHLVYVDGGNTFWLHYCIQKGDWGQPLKDAVTGSKASVYCGKSAGAIVAGACIETATWKVRRY